MSVTVRWGRVTSSAQSVPGCREGGGVGIRAASASKTAQKEEEVQREPYLHKLAHLDEGLYNDFYSLWIALLVINVLIFIVGMVLNSLALYVFCLRTKPSTTSVIYTINLAGDRSAGEPSHCPPASSSITAQASV
ncbi:hypothetical protein SKAU_G00218000 [Synaphobranchus kaupii]|uniref:Uncharacterized protein n=1 Tax=Synaphobranchus kaupii TaxID=118154 RepID=A0A9Q1FA81_SYNKA|nr:hypothetical protein SKAU_G00218000 [Synaphobranchus kaupii]